VGAVAPNCAASRGTKYTDICASQTRALPLDTFENAISSRSLRARATFADTLNRYVKHHVLVVDEVGYLAYGADAANVLLHVVSERHMRRRAMVFMTNKSEAMGSRPSRQRPRGSPLAPQKLRVAVSNRERFARSRARVAAERCRHCQLTRKLAGTYTAVERSGSGRRPRHRSSCNTAP
jgi:hypothetical protein